MDDDARSTSMRFPQIERTLNSNAVAPTAPSPAKPGAPVAGLPYLPSSPALPTGVISHPSGATLSHAPATPPVPDSRPVSVPARDWRTRSPFALALRRCDRFARENAPVLLAISAIIVVLALMRGIYALGFSSGVKHLTKLLRILREQRTEQRHT